MVFVVCAVVLLHQYIPDCTSLLVCSVNANALNIGPRQIERLPIPKVEYLQPHRTAIECSLSSDSVSESARCPMWVNGCIDMFSDVELEESSNLQMNYSFNNASHNTAS